MTVTISEDLAAKLTRMAELRGTTPEALALELWAAAVEVEKAAFPSLDQVVREIQALPPPK